MRTKTITLYKFEELSEEAQEKAINNLRDINVDYSWWDFTYEDARNIGLEINSFDLDRNRHATGKLLASMTTVIDKILHAHGETTNTYKLAKDYEKEIDSLASKYDIENENAPEENRDNYDNEFDELEENFLADLLEEYSVMLQNESEYLMTDKAIKETIELNNYEFTENGELA
ncbi:MAG: hypothetical protein ACOX6V_05075 [Patescibacteria group bacterium]|jgi:hypothetical protein